MPKLLDVFIKTNRCPTDGARLATHPVTKASMWCRMCNSTWGPIFEGTIGKDVSGTAFGNRDYLRRKLHEIEYGQLGPDRAPPQAVSSLQSGASLVDPHAFRQPVARRIIDGRARTQARGR